MGWTDDGSMECHCGAKLPGQGGEPATIQYALALGWGYFAGQTVGGIPCEVISCPPCRKGSKKRVVKKSTVPDEVIDGLVWDEPTPERENL